MLVIYVLNVNIFGLKNNNLIKYIKKQYEKK